MRYTEKEKYLIFRVSREWIKFNLVELLAVGTGKSKSDIKRLIKEGAVEVVVPVEKE